jgi:hypothetical protein
MGLPVAPQPMSVPPVPPPPPPLPSQPPPFSPSLPNSRRGGGSFRALATYSWLSVFVCMAVNIAVFGAAHSTQTREEALHKAIVAAFVPITGLLAGIIALLAIPKYGRKGLLWPALSGICVWLLLAVIALPAFNAARQKSLQIRAAREKAAQLTPVAHLPDAVRVSDAALGFSFELPSGYTSFPADKKPAAYRYAYLKMNPAKAVSVVAVETLPGTISLSHHLTAKNLPAGKGWTLTSFSWRGLDVDGVRIPEITSAGSYVTIKVQIPLKQQAIQLAFGGPADDEANVRALAEQALSTLEGAVNL